MTSPETWIGVPCPTSGLREECHEPDQDRRQSRPRKKVSDLKSSVADLAKVKPVQNGASAVTSALDKVQSNADAAVAAAKSDFPSETSAVRSARDNLEKVAQRLKSSPVATITALPGQIQAAVTAVTNLEGATSSKCG
jgi:hypothetical protein